jgi:short-subunit dehydrogenase
MKYFRDKKILITGAAGGFGAEFVRQLVPLGARLVLTDLREDGLNRVAREQGAGGPGEVIGVITADISGSAGCRDLYVSCKKLCGDIDILINNAGIITFGNFHEHPEEAIRTIIDVNLVAPMLLAKYFLADMTARRSGHVVFVSSLASVIPTAYEAVYSATKCGLRGFGMALNSEVGRLGVAVTNIYPNWANTNMLNAKRYGSLTVKRVPSAMIDDPVTVVSSSLRGIARRKLHVFPGFRAKLFAQAARVWPFVYVNPLEK